MHQAGFTLAEVMIASAIMALVLASTIVVISRGTNYMADLRLRARSSQILQQRVEELRTMNWNQVLSCPTTFTNSDDAAHLYSGLTGISAYQASGTNVTVVRATVSVVWTNRHNRTITNRLTTLISNGGLNKTSL